MVEAPGYRKLTTAFYPEGDTYIESDAVFGVKKSLVVVSVGDTASCLGTYFKRWILVVANYQGRGRSKKAWIPEGRHLQAVAEGYHSGSTSAGGVKLEKEYGRGCVSMPRGVRPSGM